LVRNSEEERPFGIPRCRWDDIIKIVRREIGYKGSGKEQVLGIFEHCTEPLGAMKLGEFLE
jgi:hypothetical protein